MRSESNQRVEAQNFGFKLNVRVFIYLSASLKQGQYSGMNCSCVVSCMMYIDSFQARFDCALINLYHGNNCWYYCLMFCVFSENKLLWPSW